MRRLLLLLVLLASGKSFATGEINVLTDLNSPFPPGCIALWLPAGPASGDNRLFDEIVPAPGVENLQWDQEVRIEIWRTGCHDPGYSIVMVRLTQVTGSEPVLVPQIYAEGGMVDFPSHQAQLIGQPAVGNIGATGNTVNPAGQTYMLAVDPFHLFDDNIRFGPADYNDVFSLEFVWSWMDPEGEWFDIDAYVPEFDPTQFEFPPLHGRMSGQYTIEGIPASGLVLHIGEQADDTNYAFVLFFTYIDGEPAWVAGNTGGMEPGFDFVDLDMEYLVGGEFFGFGPDLFDDADIDRIPIGWMTIEALDCNTLLLGYDFTDSGLGSGVTEANRLVRVAGYDCNPWN
jgi:hypothetical protein